MLVAATPARLARIADLRSQSTGAFGGPVMIGVSMPQNRREFMREIAHASGILLIRPGLGSAYVNAGGVSAASSLSARQQSFRGSTAGQERAIDGIRFCWCPPGRFLMGSPRHEVGHRPDEAQVEVTITKGYWTGKFEVTQSDWSRVVGDFPDKAPSAQFGIGDDFPVYWVNFLEAEGFCEKLTQHAHGSNALPPDWEIRLPTEAQWEYACRAGTVTATSFGEVLHPHEANFFAGSPGATRNDRWTGRARTVGSYPANQWGIQDMHGNVWEWCRDWYHSRLPGGTDPDLYNVVGIRNRDGTYSRVRRGGAWIDDAWACRSACRLRYEPPRRSDHIGFRVVAVQR